MNKLIITAFLLIAGMQNVTGQNNLLQKVNDIQKQNDVYYWAQYAHPVEDTAFVNATKWLLDEVNMQFDEANQMTVTDITPLVKRIKIDAGTKIRAFVYVRKADVAPGASQASVIPASPRASVTPHPATTLPEQAPRAFVPDVFVQTLMSRKEFYQVYQYLKEQKSQGNVLQFGALKDVEDYTSLELVLFDMQSKEIISILSPVTSGNKRTNLMTGTDDSLDNYPEDMVLAIWYIK